MHSKHLPFLLWVALCLMAHSGCKSSPVVQCSKSSDCSAGGACVAGKCVTESNALTCFTNSDCTLLEFCSGGDCKPRPCDKHAQCSGGICKSGQCVAGSTVTCETQSDCTVTQVCVGTPKTCQDATDSSCGCTPQESCTQTDPACGQKGCTIDFDCDDGNFCTQDTCDAGTCKNIKADAKCCRDNDDCDTTNSCAPEICQENKCVALGTPDPSCCSKHSDCNDSNACTTDRCLNNSCVNRVELEDPGCECVSPSDCKDGNSCTTDSCVAGKCKYSYSEGPGCCQDNSECVDSDPSTDDKCQWNVCTHEVKKSCTSAAQCNDNDACTSDTCVNGFCNNTPVADPICCNTHDSCDDKNDLTLDRCVQNRCVHSLSEEPKACELDNQCDDLNTCTDESCVSGFCSTIIKKDGGCCRTDADCNDGNSCTTNTCTDYKCITVVKSDAGCCQTDVDCKDANECTTEACVNNQCKYTAVSEKAYWQANFESGTDGFVLTGGSGAVKWQVTDYKADQGSYSLYYGDIVNHNYDTGSVNTGTATSPTIVLPNVDEIKLKFRMWAATESYDDFEVHVDVAGTKTKVYDKSASSANNTGDFIDVEADLTKFKGQSIKLVLIFDTNDSYDNDHEGVYLDAMRIVAPCTIKSCTKDEECDDQNRCTQDICDPATKICKNTEIQGCCLSDSDCNDQKDCTTDSCDESGKCVNTNICCTGDGECDDKNDCTIDSCDGKNCVYKLKQDPGCCIPNLLDSAGFEGASPLTGWTIVDEGTDVKWQVAKLRAKNGTAALYYGNPLAHNFDTDAITKGTAVSPSFKIPAGGTASLTFWLFQDSESSTSFDKFWIEVDDGATKTSVWDKSKLGGYSGLRKWQEFTADLSAFAGKTITLRLNFDSVDDGSNTGEGVYLDDLKVIMPCVVQACEKDADCDDHDSCTTNTCGTDKKCKYTAIPGCCKADKDCEDANACTKTSCVESLCKVDVICCNGDLDCNDNDACTNDSCDNGSCKYSVTANCCKPVIASNTFDTAASISDWTLVGTDNPVIWQHTSVTPVPGADGGLLYFGDIDKFNYVGDGNRVTGTATTPAIKLQPGVPSLLKFRVWLDAETTTTFDKLEVRVKGTKTVVLWDKSQLSASEYKKWVDVSVPIDAEFGGQSVTFEFKFDSVDGAGNNQLGAFIDNFSVGSQCN